MLSSMFVEHFYPWRGEHQPCWHCVRFDGLVVGGARCKMPLCCWLRSRPEGGCSEFEREVGADDVPSGRGARGAT